MLVIGGLGIEHRLWPRTHHVRACALPNGTGSTSGRACLVGIQLRQRTPANGPTCLPGLYRLERGPSHAVSQDKLNEVAGGLNERPRKSWGYETPVERYRQAVALTG